MGPQPSSETGPQTSAVRYEASPSRGDRRRAALLGALDELLRVRPLDTISVADITAAAGVSRPAFYFYFASKPAAVAALLEDFYETLLAVAAAWYDRGTAVETSASAARAAAIEGLEQGFESTVELWRTRAYLLVAMLDAVGTDTEVREVWSGWVERFIDRIAARVAADSGAGVAVAVPEPRATATVLMGATLGVMERDVRAAVDNRPPADELISALVGIWRRVLYE